MLEAGVDQLGDGRERQYSLCAEKYGIRASARPNVGLEEGCSRAGDDRKSTGVDWMRSSLRECREGTAQHQHRFNTRWGVNRMLVLASVIHRCPPILEVTASVDSFPLV